MIFRFPAHGLHLHVPGSAPVDFACRPRNIADTHVPGRDLGVRRAHQQHLRRIAGVTMATVCRNVRCDLHSSFSVVDWHMGRGSNVALGVSWVCLILDCCSTVLDI